MYFPNTKFIILKQNGFMDGKDSGKITLSPRELMDAINNGLVSIKDKGDRKLIDFRKTLESGEEVLYFDGIICNEAIGFNTLKFPLIIANCELEEINLNGLSYDKRIEIKNNSSLKKFNAPQSVNQNRIIPSIHIEDSTINHLNLSFNGCLKIISSNFYNHFSCSQIDELEIAGQTKIDCIVRFINLNKLILQDGYYRNEMNFTNITVLTLENGLFENNITFNGDQFKTIEFKNGKFEHDLNLNSLSIEQNLFFSGGNFNKINFNQSKGINGLVHFGKFGNHYNELKINDLVITGSGINNVFCFNNGVINNISIHRSSFKEALLVGYKSENKNTQEEGTKLEIQKLTFGADNTFELGVVFKNACVIKELKILGSTYKGSVNFLEANKVNNIKELTIKGGDFENGFEISKGQFGQILISDGQFKKGLKIKSGTFGVVNITGGDFEDQEMNIGPITKNAESLPNFEKLEVDLPINFNLKIQNSTFQNLVLRNRVFSNGIVSIQNSIVNHLQLNNLENRGDITFREIRVKEQSQDSSVKIINSNLLKTYFINFYFNQFNSIVFEGGVNLLEISLINSDIPAKKIEAESIQNTTNIFNQLYHVASRLKDKKLEQEYFSGYLGAYHQELSTNKEKGRRKDRIVLFFNKHSTDHGQSWPLGILFTLSVGISFFSLYYWSLENIDLNWNLKENVVANFKNGGKLLGYFFSFINPIHKPNFMENEYSLGDFSLFIDLIARIFIGYGIYQTVAAFRRLGKR